MVDNVCYEKLLESCRKDILTLGEIDDNLARDVIEKNVINHLYDSNLKDMESAVDEVFYRLRKPLGLIQKLMDRDDINEIMVNGYKDVYVERREGITKTDMEFRKEEDLEEIIMSIAADMHREFNEMSPILDGRISDGSRINAVHKKLAMKGHILTIRRFKQEKMTVRDLIDMESITPECGNFLKVLVRSGFNIFVSGGTSTGKTTFLNALSDFIPEDQRVIIIEDSAELQLKNISNLVQLQCRTENFIGKGEVNMDMLIKASLRMRPDRLIIGEVRGEEVSSMLQALNTGHIGMSTGHGNSIRGMLKRLEAMYLMGKQLPINAIAGQIVEAIDIFIHLVRMDNGMRRVSEIAEVIGYTGEEYKLNTLFKSVWDKGRIRLMRTDNKLVNTEKLLYGECRDM